MRRATYDSLMILHQCYGPREFGKLCQKLFALSYRRAGFVHVIERGVQGVDVDAADGQRKFATEVKTTLGTAIVFQAKDVAGLVARQNDGYLPLLGVLRLSPLSDWLLADAAHLEAGRLSLDMLRPYRCHELEGHLRQHFDAVVEEHGEAAFAGAQAYLDEALRKHGIEQSQT